MLIPKEKVPASVLSGQTKTPKKKILSLSKAMVISLIGHCLILWLWSAASLTGDQPVRTDDTLQLELFGMISDWESSERAAVAAAAAPEPSPVVPVIPEPEEPPVPEPEPEPPVEKPLPPEAVPAPKPKKLPPPQPRPQPVRPQPAEPAIGQIGQIQRTFARDMEISAEKKYLSQTVRAVNSRLSFPEGAREKGQTGRPVVSFRIDNTGAIRAGSVILRKSSGYSILDEDALRAVRTASFRVPPPSLADKEITLTLGYSWERTRAR
jgi:TonB family protein